VPEHHQQAEGKISLVHAEEASFCTFSKTAKKLEIRIALEYFSIVAQISHPQ